MLYAWDQRTDLSHIFPYLHLSCLLLLNEALHLLYCLSPSLLNLVSRPEILCVLKSTSLLESLD